MNDSLVDTKSLSLLTCENNLRWINFLVLLKKQEF